MSAGKKNKRKSTRKSNHINATPVQRASGTRQRRQATAKSNALPKIGAAIAAVFLSVFAVGRRGAGALSSRVRNSRIDTAFWKLGLVALAAILLLGFGGFGVYHLITNKNGQAVYLNGETIGIMKYTKNKPVTAGDLLLLATKKLEADLGVPVQINETITTEPVRVKTAEIMTDDYILNELVVKFTYLVQAAQISVDGQVMATLRTEQEATALFDIIQSDHLQTGLNIESVSFVEDVVTTLTFVEEDTIDSHERALEILTRNSDEKVMYTIASGDTLDQIAMDANMTRAELLALNPSFTADSILRIGDQLTLRTSRPFLSVQTKERVTYNDIIKKPVDIRYNDEEHTSYSKILQQGRDGQQTVEAFIVRVNKIEVDREVINSTVLEEPITEIKEVGTSTTLPRRAIGLFIQPTSGILTDYFGTRGGSHAGIDFANKSGTPIYASDGGVVTKAGNSGDGYGKQIVIDHGNGFTSSYAHNSKLLVSVGQAVAQGERIALMGSTGNSTGSHCHFEIHLNGTPVNPFNYIR